MLNVTTSASGENINQKRGPFNELKLGKFLYGYKSSEILSATLDLVNQGQ